MNIFYCNNKNPFRNVKTRSILYTSVADLGEGPTHPLFWIKKKKSQEKSLQGKQNNPTPHSHHYHFKAQGLLLHLNYVRQKVILCKCFLFQLAMATVMVKESRCQILTYTSEMSFNILIKSLLTMLEYQYLCLDTLWLVLVPLKSPTRRE